MHRSRLKKAEFLIRNAIPESIKQIVRAFNSVRKPEYSAEVPDELLENCRVVSSRVAIIEKMKKDAVVAELGTFSGQFARKIVKRARPRELHLIDITFSQFSSEGLEGEEVFRHEGLTTEVMKSFPDHYFDWIYIDADHSYRGAMQDAEISHQKLKPGGYLIFNDFGHVSPAGSRFGVHRAAVDFSIRKNYKWVYLSYHISALYDLALQKPG